MSTPIKWLGPVSAKGRSGSPREAKAETSLSQNGYGPHTHTHVFSGLPLAGQEWPDPSGFGFRQPFALGAVFTACYLRIKQIMIIKWN